MHDFDFIIVGSGFGGSVAALRLSERGHRVCVLERGRRFAPEDFARTNWNLPRYLWFPRLGWRGPQELHLFKRLLALTGSGVGGGSLIYGGVLDEPPPAFFERGAFAGLADWRKELEPHFAEARRMLGAARAPFGDRFDHAFASAARATGGEHQAPEVGVTFGPTPNAELGDPHFGGSGPMRRACNFCGGCMIGCRHGAKNTLDLNYLHLAERAGATVLSDSMVRSIAPLGGADGREGYLVSVVRPGVIDCGKSRLTARRVIVAAGTIGTNRLLLRCRDVLRTLPRLSRALGTRVTNNREEFLFVRAREAGSTEGVAVGSLARTGSTTILGARTGPGGSLFLTFGAPFPASDPYPGLLGGLFRSLSNPARTLRLISPRRWAESTRALVAMESGEGPEGQFSLRGGRMQLAARYPISLPGARDFALRAAAELDGTVQPMAATALLNIPVTAHVFGGCPMGTRHEEAVVDAKHQVFGYQGLYVLDGSTISSNPGVAPSLYITALAERAVAEM